MEVLFPGTDHEMVTVYYEQDGVLLLTHYCVAGYRPSMTASQSSTDTNLEFGCTNIPVSGEAHMHKASLAFVGKNEFPSQWFMFEKGKQTHAAKFHLVRKQYWLLNRD